MQVTLNRSVNISLPLVLVKGAKVTVVTHFEVPRPSWPCPFTGGTPVAPKNKSLPKSVHSQEWLCHWWHRHSCLCVFAPSEDVETRGESVPLPLPGTPPLPLETQVNRGPGRDARGRGQDALATAGETPALPPRHRRRRNIALGCPSHNRGCSDCPSN